MMRNEPYFRTQRILRRQPLHASCSAMRSTDDTREGCNQKTTYIMPYDWEHAHDVMRREPEQCFTVNILLHDSIWLQTMVSNRSRSCRAERRTVQRVNKPFYIFHGFSVCLFYHIIVLCSKVMIRIFQTMDGYETIIIMFLRAPYTSDVV